MKIEKKLLILENTQKIFLTLLLLMNVIDDEQMMKEIGEKF
jgi:hypothetical protein